MGKFITFEGVEGVGKSTQCKRLAVSLESELNADVVMTREPGGTALGETLRSVLLDPQLPAISDISELLLMFAARADHLENVIRPALAKGAWVICDRFTDATFAYQGGGRGIDYHLIEQLESLVQGELRPDITLLLDMDVADGLARASKRGAADRFERERIEFFERVRNAYLEQARRAPARVLVVDAAQDIDAVARMVFEKVREALE